MEYVGNITKASRLKIATKAGDIYFINNLAILYRRKGFLDDAASGR